MNKNLPFAVATLAILIALAGIGYGAKSARSRQEAEKQLLALQAQAAHRATPVAAANKASTNSTDAAAADTLAGLASETNSVEALQAEIVALRAELANRRDRPPRESWEDRMARMKAEDPEGYAEMIKRRQEQQQTMRYNLAERTASFMDLDTSFMTDEELANHNLLVEKMAAIWEMTEKFQDPEQRPDREAMGQMFNTMREVRPLLEQERNTMFRQLAIDVGYAGDDTQAFAEHIQGILDATSMRMPGGGFPGGRGGRDRGAPEGGGDRAP